jgi:hypothetical protein
MRDLFCGIFVFTKAITKQVNIVNHKTEAEAWIVLLASVHLLQNVIVIWVSCKYIINNVL